MKISPNSFRVLVLLFKSNTALTAFTVYRRLRLTYSQFNKSVSELSHMQLVEISDNRISISKHGKDILIQQKSSYIFTGAKTWRNIPDNFIGNKIEPNDFYVPALSKLDSGFKSKK